jgi:hypothetical protein
MGVMRNVYKLLVRMPEEKGHLEDPGVDGKTIQNWFLKK